MLTSKVTFWNLCGSSHTAGAAFYALTVSFIKPGMVNLSRGINAGGGEVVVMCKSGKEVYPHKEIDMVAKAMSLETREVEGTDHRGTHSSAPLCRGPLVPHQRAFLTLLGQNQERQNAAFSHRVANAPNSAAEAVSQPCSPTLGHLASALLQGICDLRGQLLTKASSSSRSE